MSEVIYEDPVCVVEQELGNVPTIRSREIDEPQRISTGLLESAGLFENVQIIVRFGWSDFRLSDFDGKSWLTTPLWYGISFDYFGCIGGGVIYTEHEGHALQSKDLDIFADSHIVRCLTCGEIML